MSHECFWFVGEVDFNRAILEGREKVFCPHCEQAFNVFPDCCTFEIAKANGKKNFVCDCGAKWHKNSHKWLRGS